MHDTARKRIFSRLHAAGLKRETPEAAATPIPDGGSREEKIKRLQTQMEAVRAEVHEVEKGRWPEQLKALARQRQWKKIVCGTDAAIAGALKAAWQDDAEGLPQLLFYTEEIETFKTPLFKTDAGVTSTAGAVADTGAVILWPTSDEPRLLSVVPPVHIALVEADRIYGSLDEAMQAQKWEEGMPTNVLLVSGPSKTADIEFTLVYGVHGPREMIVFVLRERGGM